MSREWIVNEAVAIVRAEGLEEGLEKATVRRVAQALDTGRSPLHAYVADTAELRAAVLDELLAPVVEPPAAARAARWRTNPEEVLTAYRDVLLAHPGLARSALVLRPHGPRAVRLHDRVLELLPAGGVDAARAAWGWTCCCSTSPPPPPSTARHRRTATRGEGPHRESVTSARVP
ncbi:TetR/AcrR family transcriptional regulator [Kineococcus aurantiacus]|uniref:AcrR family transcriptional regulator n=1 Tax=Kineococcus aurantiacus TaxID=37633 RepID=A0A7Y9J2Z1_9ACTN|nr:TetR/AcrR family transcriptional regulator C-terminal domain-containing protein [Kineococcus aurantiacus]NYD24771.1 AcrR family transcriptional regulator [Kineococcus aurantiacus]